jgi:hypothetical protein
VLVLVLGKLVLIMMIPRAFGDEICGCPLPFVVLYLIVSLPPMVAVRGLVVVLWAGEDNLLDGWKDLRSLDGAACGSR